MASAWSIDPSQCQQGLYKLFSGSDYDEYEPEILDGKQILLRKVGYAIFSVPDEEPSRKNGNTGYSENKYETIRKVSEAIIAANNQTGAASDNNKNEAASANNQNEAASKTKKKLRMAIIFVFVQYNNNLLQYPVFRILLSAKESNYRFVDTDCRMYLGWINFLRDNGLPPGKFCWPANGIYSADESGKVNLGWGITPAATEEQQNIQKLDSASSWIGVRSSAVLLGSLFFPVWGPLVTAAGVATGVTGVYSALRSGGSLVDRYAHGQTINPLKERQVASSWICTLGSMAAIGGGIMTNRAAKMAASGQVMGGTSQFICNALNVTSLATNFTGVGFGAFCIFERRTQGELTNLEIYQLASSVLFFSHAFMSFQTASSIIKDTQNRVIQDFESSLRSNRHRKEFKKLAKRTIAEGETPVDGNAKIIRSIRNIDNKNDFFAGLVRTKKDLRGHKTVFSENGNIVVDSGAEIHPMKLYDLGKDQRQEFLAMAREAAQNNTSENTSLSSTSGIVNNNVSLDFKGLMNNVASEAINILWAQLQEMYPDRFITMNEALLVVHTVNEITTITCSYQNKNYARYWKLIWEHVNKLIKTALDTHKAAVEMAKKVGEFTNQKDFNISRGITFVNEFVYYVFKVYENLKTTYKELAAQIEKEQKQSNS